MPDNPTPGLSPGWKCPLDDTDCAKLTQALQQCADLECYFAQLAAIGMPVDQWMADVATLKGMATGLKAVHFPGRT
jgi:hypothetical protein